MSSKSLSRVIKISAAVEENAHPCTALIGAATGLSITGGHGDGTGGLREDIVAVPGNPLDDIAVMEQVSFVMKAGRIYKMDGAPMVITPASR